MKNNGLNLSLCPTFTSIAILEALFKPWIKPEVLALIIHHQGGSSIQWWPLVNKQCLYSIPHCPVSKRSLLQIIYVTQCYKIGYTNLTIRKILKKLMEAFINTQWNVNSNFKIWCISFNDVDLHQIKYIVGYCVWTYTTVISWQSFRTAKEANMFQHFITCNLDS